MPYPDYTEAECLAAILDIDAKIVELRGKATSVSIGNKSFNFNGVMACLRAERQEWTTRYQALTGGAHPLQGPKFTLV